MQGSWSGSSLARADRPIQRSPPARTISHAHHAPPRTPRTHATRPHPAPLSSAHWHLPAPPAPPATPAPLAASRGPSPPSTLPLLRQTGPARTASPGKRKKPPRPAPASMRIPAEASRWPTTQVLGRCPSCRVHPPVPSPNLPQTSPISVCSPAPAPAPASAGHGLCAPLLRPCFCLCILRFALMR